jgi:hypothetical protein
MMKVDEYRKTFSLNQVFIGIKRLFPNRFARRLALLLGGSTLTSIVLLWLVLVKAYDFLAINRPVENPDAVVIEAWIPPYALNTIARQLKQSPRTKIILVGGDRYNNYFILGRQRTPTLIFHPSLASDHPIISDTISVKALGTYVAGDWGHIEIRVNQQVVGSTYTDNESKYYHFPTHTGNKPLETVSVTMDNAYTIWKYPEKREAWIYHLKINNQKFIPYDPTVIYGFRNFNLIYTEELQYTEQTDFTACILEEMGIPRDRMVRLKRTQSDNSRTYLNAKLVAKWLHQEADSISSVNIYSQAAHTRRSYEMYKYTLGENIETGVIALQHKLYNQNWWESSRGVKLMSEQILKYLISKVFFYLIVE